MLTISHPLCKEHFPTRHERQQAIPGIMERAAIVIIAETGADAGRFQKSSNLVGRCGLKPPGDESNRKAKSNKITCGNRFLRKILIEIARTASRTLICFFSNFNYVQCTQKRKTKVKIQVATAQKILVRIRHCSPTTGTS